MDEPNKVHVPEPHAAELRMMTLSPTKAMQINEQIKAERYLFADPVARWKLMGQDLIRRS